MGSASTKNRKMSTMEGKITLVTGANSGLGKAMALGLAKLGRTAHSSC